MPPAGAEAVAAAVAEVLDKAEYRDKARRAAEQIAAMPSPGEVAERLVSLLG
jgi:UDP:flavonoid glycosyltransferase YjiC (YdhE family)